MKIKFEINHSILNLYYRKVWIINCQGKVSKIINCQVNLYLFLFIINQKQEINTHSEPSKVCNMELFAKIINSWTLHLRSAIGFGMRFCLIKKLYERHLLSKGEQVTSVLVTFMFVIDLIFIYLFIYISFYLVLIYLLLTTFKITV